MDLSQILNSFTLFNLSYEQNISTDWSPNVQHHSDFVSPVNDRDCSYLYSVNPEDRCHFVRNTENCNEGVRLFNYLEFLFCTLPTYMDNISGRILTYCVMVFFLLYLFLAMATTAEHFFCPALGVIAKVMHMTESLAGVTLLSMGNGAPDVFAAIASAKSDTALMVGQLYGGGIFITCVVAGSICIIAPFKLYPPDMIRNCIFYVIGVIYTSILIHGGRIATNDAMGIIIIYLGFLGTVLIMFYYDWRKKLIINQQHEDDVKRGMTQNKAGLQVALPVSVGGNRKRGVSLGANNDISKQHEFKEHNDVNMCADFFHQMLPITKDEWAELKGIAKVIAIFQIPLLIVLKFFLPVCNYKVHLHGWTRILNSIHICTCPILVFIQLELFEKKVSDFPLVIIIEFILFLAALVVIIITDTNDRPSKHDLFAFLTFIGSIMILWAIADEIVSMLRALAHIFTISDNAMGLSVMACGNSIGDLVANILMAKQGFPRMGYVACFGAPFFSLTVGMGLCFIKRIQFTTSGIAMVRPGSLGYNCAYFLALSLMGTFFFMSLTGFKTRRSYGFWLVTLWIIFIVSAVLAELEIIHSYGTDHSGAPYRSVDIVIGKIEYNSEE